MQNNVNKYVRVSDIATYYFCPKRTYFNLRQPHDVSVPEVRADIYKAISAALPGALSASSPEEHIREAVHMACDDELVIYGTKITETVEMVRSEAAGLAGAMVEGARIEEQRLGEERFYRLLSAASMTEAIYSDRLRMSGTIDRVAVAGNDRLPVVVSTSAPPPSGIYGRERVKLAAYSLLLAEKYGNPVAGGVVEYVTGWRLRETTVRSDDKRKVLYARNRILEMLQGKMPDARRGEWCKRCDHQGQCTVKVSFLDSLFKK